MPGIPDAPLDIQVEVGPQDGTLLVTWLPVTITTAGTSNGCLVTGYSLYIDGHRIKDVTSPTGDHIILGWKDVFDVTTDPRQVCMKVKLLKKYRWTLAHFFLKSHVQNNI